MQVFCANHKGWFVHHWAARLPGTIGHLWSPTDTKVTVYPNLQRACDNGRFAATIHGRLWYEEDFLEFAKQEASRDSKPLWIAVPDVWGDAAATLEDWDYWEPRLRPLGVPLAMVVQDGMVPNDTQPADVIFVGGSDQWRWENLESFISTGKPVHVGRINGNTIWDCDRMGAASCDGTGWFRGDKVQLAKLEYYLRCKVGEALPPSNGINPLDDSHVALRFYRRWFSSPEKPNYWCDRIPQNISKDDILSAIQYWMTPPARSRPTRYVVEFEGRLFPAKQLISQANFWANGAIWPTRCFLGGSETNRFLAARGFPVRIASADEINSIEMASS